MTLTMADALRIVYKRGHLTALHQGNGIECARCGASGSVGADGQQIGAIFTKTCGTPTGVSYDYGATRQ